MYTEYIKVLYCYYIIILYGENSPEHYSRMIIAKYKRLLDWEIYMYTTVEAGNPYIHISCSQGKVYYGGFAFYWALRF